MLQLSPLDLPAPGLEVLQVPRAVAPIASHLKALRHRVRFAVRPSPSPMDIFAQTQTIFVRIPKNASSSIIDYLYPDRAGRGIAHYGADFYRRIFPEIYDSYLVFAILREPLSRFASAFSYYRYTSPVVKEREMMERTMGGEGDFSDFLECIVKHEDIANIPIMKWHHFRKQKDYICDEKGRIIVDLLFTVEDMAPGLAVLEKHVGRAGEVPRLNQSKQQDLTDPRLQRISEYYAEDVALWQNVKSAGILEFKGHSH